jgi:hypothetical protein
MFHFKAPGRVMRESDAADWGRFSWYIEVADDQFATRQVDLFENGNILRYDRSHRRDRFGFLLALRFSRKPKWAKSFPGSELISETEFERVWRLALSSDSWRIQSEYTVSSEP